MAVTYGFCKTMPLVLLCFQLHVKNSADVSLGTIVIKTKEAVVDTILSQEMHFLSQTHHLV